MNLRILGLVLAVLAPAALTAGCSKRPLRPLNPCTISGVTNKLGSNVNEVDMLFMIDTSTSMAEEQALLRTALPELVNALVAGQSPSDDVACAAAGPDCRIFRPVKSLRVGVVTSDIGTIRNTGGYCTDAGEDGIVAENFRQPVDANCGTTIQPVARPDFLQFDEGDGMAAQATFEDQFKCYADQGGNGCGYEQQLEAVLKALAGSRAGAEPITFIDFTPDAETALRTSTGNSQPGGPNEGFVRPNSLLAIVMVTDEDDCSGDDSDLYDGAGSFPSDSATAVWNDWATLRWGGWVGGAPAGPEVNTVAEAGAVDAADANAKRDLQLRCFEFTQFLYSTQRYIDGILDLRDPSASDLIVFSAITGIDQSVVIAARDEEEANGTNRFDYMLADPTMQEAIDYDYRDLRQYVVDATSAQLLDRPRPACFGFSDVPAVIPPEQDTLGTACTSTVDCIANLTTTPSRLLDVPIECDLRAGSPGVCKIAGGAAPARRIIEVVKGIEDGGGSGLVESICQDDFSGALNSIINKLADVLNRACLPEPLNPDSSGKVNCEVVEYLPTSGEYIHCEDVAAAGLGRDATPVRIEDGREVCRIQQIAIDHNNPVVPPDTTPGWYYDDFTTGTMGESAQELCTTDAGTYQRIAFTELGKPVTGASVRLECLQPAVGGTTTDAQIATPCAWTVDDATMPICTGEVADSYPMGMLCDSLSNTCQVACATTADCPGGFVCYTRDEPSPDATSRVPCTGDGDCTPEYPVCGAVGLCISDAEAASTRSFCANPTCDTTGIGGS